MSNPLLQSQEVFAAARAVMLDALSPQVHAGEAGALGEGFAASRSAAGGSVANGDEPEVIASSAVDASQGVMDPDAAHFSVGGITEGFVHLGARAPEVREKGKTPYRSAEVGELWSQPSRTRTLPREFPKALESQRAVAHRKEVEQAVMRRAGELEVMWSRRDGQFRANQLRRYGRNRRPNAEKPEVLDKVLRPLDRVANLRARIEAKRAKAEAELVDAGPLEAAKLKTKLAFYEHQLSRVETLEDRHSNRVDAKISDEGERLAMLADVETALDPTMPPEGRLSTLLQSWFGVVTGFLSGLSEQQDAAEVEAEATRKVDAEHERLLRDRAEKKREVMAAQKQKRTVAPPEPPASEPAPEPVNPYSIPGFRLIRG